MPGRKAVFVLGPDACGTVLQNGDKAFVNGWEYLVGPFFHRGLMLLDGAEHKQHRRILQQAFTRERIEGYTAALHPAVARELDSWRGGARLPGIPGAQAADAQPRHPDLHGRPPDRRPGAAGPGQPGLRRLRAGGRRDPARGGSGQQVAPRDARAGGAGALPDRPAPGGPGRGRRRPVLRAHPGRGRGRHAVRRRRRRQPHDLPADGGARHLDVDGVDRDVPPGPRPRVAGTGPRGGPRARTGSDRAAARPGCATWTW